jgi:hypothetical protein
MNPLIQLKQITSVFLVAIALAWFAISPALQAVSPAPDGGYPGRNTAEGDSALHSLTSGVDNTAIGFDVLFYNTTGNYNTATGYEALSFNTTGNSNTATGFYALLHNTTGSDNTANGYGALLKNTGTGNTATGYGALFNNTTGSYNTANGDAALVSNTTGQNNTAAGVNALSSNNVGIQNTASGNGALKANTTGGSNTANGFQALYSNTTGGSNIALGVHAGLYLTTGDYNIDIGNDGVAGDASKIRIGTVGTQNATFIAGIHGATASGGTAVFVNSSGQLGTLTSSERFKEQIKPMDTASDAILALKPVTFHYKHEVDPNGIPQFGLVAEDVEKVNPDLIVRDREGKPYSVRYEAVNAMLLNEFLKEHRKVEQLEARVAQQEKDFAARLKEQDAKIQQVSDKVELSKPTSRTVNNSP